MRKIVLLMAALLGVAGGAVAEEVVNLNTAYPGMVLLPSYLCKYKVEKNCPPIKSTSPGQSGLRVLPGTTAVIEIDGDATLEVWGGDAFGALPAGAGIEVPYGAKLVVCGPDNDTQKGGFLNVYGGNAAPGGQGYGGSAGLESVMKDPASYALGRSPYPDGMKKDFVSNGVKMSDFCATALPLLFAGSGGTGGDGGGGAGAAIGGCGGRGGAGGAGGEGRLIIGRSAYDGRKADMRTASSSSA